MFKKSDIALVGGGNMAYSWEKQPVFAGARPGFMMDQRAADSTGEESNMGLEKAFAVVFVLGMSILMLAACDVEESTGMSRKQPSLPVLTDVQINALSGKTFYFAHQSVGYNIVDGVEKVLKRMGLQGLFEVKELQPDEPMPSSGLLHTTIGENGDPEGKMDEFQAFLDERLGDSGPDMAMLKFCYVDIGKDTDVSALAKKYSQTMSKLGETHPQTVFLYSTVPLRVFNDSWKAGIKRLLGMEVWGDQANIKRNEYNALIRKKYAATGRLADIADWESRFPDGREYRVEVLGGRHAALIPDYSDDGKHLNAYGQQIVAGRLLAFLAGLVTEEPKSDVERESEGK